MREVICPHCGAENKYKERHYAIRPVRILNSQISRNAYLTCILCGWERRLFRLEIWIWRRYERNYRDRYN